MNATTYPATRVTSIFCTVMALCLATTRAIAAGVLPASPIRSSQTTEDSSPQTIAQATKLGEVSAQEDIQAGRFRILEYGGAPGLITTDAKTGWRVQSIAGCHYTSQVRAEADAYNRVMRAWHTKQQVEVVPLQPGKPVPELSYLRIKDADSGEMSSLREAHHGKIVVILFWESTSEPCLKAMAEFQKIAAKFVKQKDRIDFLTLGVDGRDETEARKIPAALEKSAALLRQKNWTQTVNGWSVFEDLKDWRITTLPRHCIIGADGKLAVIDPEGPLEDILSAMLTK